MPNDALDIVDSRYGKLTIFVNDIGALTQSLRAYGEWAQNEISFLQQFVGMGGTVLDVGAYIGTHALAFSNIVGSTGRVISLEAQPETFEVLCMNVARNAPDVIRPVNAIASSEAGQMAIPTIDVRNQSSFGSASLVDALANMPGDRTSQGKLTPGHAVVRAMTVDSLALQTCALVKIDVEGLEHMVLRGALETLRRCSPIVYCECNTLASGLKSLSFFETNGYKVFAHVVRAFNEENYFNNRQNVFGNACEVALVGVPLHRAAEIRRLPARRFDLLLDVENADDLALALLNKPQYQNEVLRPSHAAQTGGAQILDQWVSLEGNLDRLRSENDNLQSTRATERDAYERQLRTAGEEAQERLAGVHELLAERDASIVHLQALLTERDASLVQFQAQISDKGREMAALHALLSERDGSIVRLQSWLAERDTSLTQLQAQINAQSLEMSELHGLVRQKEIRVEELLVREATRDRELARINEQVLSISRSTSWRLTKPIRWMSEQVRGFRGR